MTNSDFEAANKMVVAAGGVAQDWAFLMRAWDRDGYRPTVRCNTRGNVALANWYDDLMQMSGRAGRAWRTY